MCGLMKISKVENLKKTVDSKPCPMAHGRRKSLHVKSQHHTVSGIQVPHSSRPQNRLLHKSTNSLARDHKLETAALEGTVTLEGWIAF